MSIFELFKRFIYFILFIKLTIAWDSGLKKKFDGYGEDWIFMPDGKNQPQVAILKNSDDDKRFFFNETIYYILYTRVGPKNGVNLYINDTDSLRNSNFSSSKITKIITHGWKSNAFVKSIVNMKNEYLKYGDYNVIVVDWEPLASSSFYLGPMRNTVKVGRNAAMLINFLVKETGHSLGAHVAGNTGEATFGKLGRVTGLDPALPGFHLLSSEKGRLDSSDAQFVDVIHSCGGVLGFLQTLGDVDFFPNAGAAVQPGCCCVPEIIDACSHGRAYEYFTESINPKSNLLAKSCDNWDDYMGGKCANSPSTLMGEHVNSLAKGSYFLRTRSKQPFGFG